VKRLSARPAVFLFTRALVTDDFGPIRERVRRELAGQERRTLDVGCGPGTFADLFAGEDYVGVDTNRRHIEYARRIRPGAFLTGGLRNLELPEARFDQALACGLFEHLADGAALAVLAEVRRVLVPGGRLLVIAELPAPDRLGRLRQRLLGPVARRPEGYRRLLEEAGTLARLDAFRSGLTECLAALVRTRESAPRGLTA
jgi:SAM-dependent methyltransferase